MPGLKEVSRQCRRASTGSDQPEHPWIVKVVLASLDQQHFEVVIEVGQTPRNNASSRPSCSHRQPYPLLDASGLLSLTSTNNNINLVRDRHGARSVSMYGVVLDG